MLAALAQFLALLADPNNLIIVLLLAIGYLVKYALPFVPSQYYQTVVLLSGLLAGPVFISPVAVGIARGIIYSALSMLLYDLAISRVEDYITSLLPVRKTTPETLQLPPKI